MSHRHFFLLRIPQFRKGNDCRLAHFSICFTCLLVKKATEMEANTYVRDATTLRKGLVGVWQSAALEKAAKDTGRIMYRRRVFDIQPDHFSLLIDVFADPAGLLY